jgi:hypothetical protein
MPHFNASRKLLTLRAAGSSNGPAQRGPARHCRASVRAPPPNLPHPSIALSAWKITRYHYCVSAPFRMCEMRYMYGASSNDSRQTELNNLGERS